MSTKAIILKSTNYTNTSLILQLLTNDYGRISAIIKGIRKKNPSKPQSYFLPLNLVNVELAESKNELKTIKDIDLEYLSNSIFHSFNKTSQAIFISEVILKTVREKNKDENLFNFIFNSIKFLNEIEINCANFHISFLALLTKYIGIFPENTLDSKKQNFDIANGSFLEKKNTPPSYSEIILKKFFTCKYSELNSIKLNSIQRNEVTKILLKFYLFHFPGMGKINSHKVLSELFE